MQQEPSNHDKNVVNPDEEFIPYESRLSQLSPLKFLTLLGIPLSLYQIATGLYFNSTHSSFFNLSLTLTGFFSLTLLGLALNWIRSTVDDNEKETVLFDKKRERLSTMSFLIFSLLKVAMSPIMIANIFLQKNYMSDHLIANTSNIESMGTFHAMTIAFAVVELVFFFYSMLSSATGLNLAKRPRKMHSTFIYISNAVILGAGLALIFTAGRISSLDNYPRLESLFPSWNIKGFTALGGMAASLSFFVWLVNFRKWRVGFFSLALILGNLGLLSLVFSGFAYSNVGRIYHTYSNTENVEEFRARIAYVSENELSNYGCPRKYLLGATCEDGLLLSAWESDETTSDQEYCVNKDCSGILGQMYSGKFLHLANWGLLASVTMIMMAVSLMYSSVTRGAFKHERRSRKNFSWLALLGTVGLICVLTYGFYPTHNIQEFQHQDYEEPLTLSAWSFSDFKTKLGGILGKVKDDAQKEVVSGFGLDKNVAYKLTEFIQLKTNRYLILEPVRANRTVKFYKDGPLSDTYNDFVESLPANNAELGLVRTEINGQERVIAVIWAPKTAAPEDVELLVKEYAPNYETVSYQKQLKIPIVIANDKETLKIDNINSKLANMPAFMNDYAQYLGAPGAKAPPEYLAARGAQPPQDEYLKPVRSGKGDDEYLAAPGAKPPQNEYLSRPSKSGKDDDDEYLAARGAQPPQDEYLKPVRSGKGDDEYLAARGAQPPQADYLAARGAQPPQDQYLAARGAQPPQDQYLKPVRSGKGDDEYLAARGAQPPQGEYLAARGAQPPQDQYLAARGAQPPQAEYLAARGAQPPQDQYLAARGAQPPQDQYLKPVRSGKGDDELELVAPMPQSPEEEYLAAMEAWSLGGLTSGFGDKTGGILDNIKQSATDQVAKGMGLDKNIAYQIAQMVQFKTSRYLLLAPNKTEKSVEFYKSGSLSESYDDFLKSLPSDKALLGLVRTTVKGVERVVAVIWAPKTAAPEDVEILVKNYAPDYQTVSYNKQLKVPIVLASDKKSLEISNIESKLGNIPADVYLGAPGAKAPPEYLAARGAQPPQDQYLKPVRSGKGDDELIYLTQWELPGGIKPPQDEYLRPKKVRTTHDKGDEEYLAARGAQPPQDEYLKPVRSGKGDDEYLAARGAQPPQDQYLKPVRSGKGDDEYLAAPGAKPPQAEYLAARGAQPPQDEYLKPVRSGKGDDEYLAAPGAKPPQAEYLAARGAQPPQAEYLAARGAQPPTN